MAVVLRPIQGTDLDAMYTMLTDPESRQMAPFVDIDFTDRDTFELRIAQLKVDPTVQLYGMHAVGHFVGACMSFDGADGREVFYWTRRLTYSRPLMIEGVNRLLNLDHTRPIFARALACNPRAQAVLAACHFTEVSREAAEDPEGNPTEELLYRRID